MKLSSNGLALLESFEGFRSKAYKVVKTEKYYTIGYGHYGPDVHFGDTITKAKAEALLKSDVAAAEKAVDKYVKVKLNQNQFDALVSFVYNVGAGAFSSSTLLKELNKGDYQAASAQFPRWNKSGGKVLPGLVTRREEEKALFDKPVMKKQKTYTVKKGDTLSEIAEKFGTTVKEIAKLNGIKDPDYITIGQKLKLPNK